MDESLSHNDEAHASSSHSGRRGGGWITFPFITGLSLSLHLFHFISLLTHNSVSVVIVEHSIRVMIMNFHIAQGLW